MSKPAELSAITKEDFEGYISATLTDEQWVKVADEISGRVENYLDGLLTDLVEDYKENVGVFDND